MDNTKLTELARGSAGKITCPVCASVGFASTEKLILTALNDEWEKQVAQQVQSLTAERDNLRVLLRDSCEDDETIRKACRGVLTDFEIDGDSYGVPGIPEIVESLLKKVEALKADKYYLKAELAAAKGVK